MSRFVDGPVAGSALALGRVPIFLRVVISAADRVDALDQVDDMPADDERIHVYELVPGTDQGVALVRVQTRGRGTTCIAMALADYRHRPDVDGEEFRDTAAWRTWCLEAVANR